ncbi:hypothetical protein VPH35_020397 [Triticum aestivum]|uniref:Uncharacterized protein n=1 Tax=Triticum aestivum TaxID=4565 RepID=A0A3B6AW59_WHEAT
MDGVYGRIEVFPQHFTPEKEPMDGADGLSTSKSNMDPSPSPRRRSWTPKRVKGVYRFCNCCLFLALGGLPATRMMIRLQCFLTISNLCFCHVSRILSYKYTDGFHCYQTELTRAEVESLRSEITNADERVSQLKARLENIDEALRYALLSGYLHIRSRWTQLPGEPPIIDDADVDDWLPRFVVLQGQCLYYYLKCTEANLVSATSMSLVAIVYGGIKSSYIITIPITYGR